MFELFLCCSPADRAVADAISARLEFAGMTVVIDDSEQESVAARWEGGLSGGGILLLLSPEGAPPRVDRKDWGSLLDHISRNTPPPVASLLVRPCGYPRMLERKNFFQWSSGPLEALRGIERWALALDAPRGQRSFSPARLPWFEGCEEQLGRLWETLVDGAGTAIVVNPGAASGKTSLAQEFSRTAAGHFREIVWIACGERSMSSIAAELAEQIGVNCPDESALAILMEVAGRDRVLIVLDDVQPDVAIPERSGRASLLVTARSAQIAREARIVQTGEPVELAPSIPEEATDVRLWRAMAVCRPTGFPLELAARIAQVDPADAKEPCSRLIQRRLVDPFDDIRGWYRLSARSIAAAGNLNEERRRHCEVVSEIASEWVKRPDFAKQYIGEMSAAFRWAAVADWPRAAPIARHAFALLRRLSRVNEGVEMLTALRDAADQRHDWEISDECSWELSWIRGVPYRAAGFTPPEGEQLPLDFGS